MMRRNHYRILGLLLLAVWMGKAVADFAMTPMAQVQETIERVRVIGQSARGAGAAEWVRQKEMVREVLLPRFDFKEMARMSLGSHWNRQVEKQREFVAVFTDFIENAYASKIESLRGAQIIYVQERLQGGLAQVDTKFVPNDGDEIPIQYRLRLVEDEWKIYDVLIENVSLVENYRAQFSRILSNTTFDDLLRKLQQKTPAKGG